MRADNNTQPSRSCPPSAHAETAATRRVLRTIAVFAAFKGAVAVVACLGLLGFMHQDLRDAATALVSHLGLWPRGHGLAGWLGQLDELIRADRSALVLAGGVYALVRLTEAWGLWQGRLWGELLGALSGAIYVPFEMLHMIHHPQALTAAVLAANVVVVGFLTWRVWRVWRRQGARPAPQYSVSTSHAMQ